MKPVKNNKDDKNGHGSCKNFEMNSMLVENKNSNYFKNQSNYKNTCKVKCKELPMAKIPEDNALPNYNGDNKFLNN